MILPLALSTSKIAEMQVHTGTYPGSGIEFNGKKLLNFKAFFHFSHTLVYQIEVQDQINVQALFKQSKIKVVQ